MKIKLLKNYYKLTLINPTKEGLFKFCKFLLFYFLNCENYFYEFKETKKLLNV